MLRSNEMLDMSYEKKSQNVASTHSPITPLAQQPVTLITGGAGFLGSHLCDRLIEEGHYVICMDNLLTGRKENIAHLLNSEKFTFINQDVTQHIDLDTSLAGPHGPLAHQSNNPLTHHPSPNTQHLSYILHFACPASPKDYLRYPIKTMEVGALGTYNMLELAREKKAVFLLASTSEIYGDPEVNPQPEDYWGHVNSIGPRSVYDEAKRYAEALTMAYHRKHGVDIRIARIFNTYGPRMKVDDGRAVSNFAVQALGGASITVYGDGTQTRSFCYVDDLIEGIYRLLLWDPSLADHSSTHEPINTSQHPRPNTEDATLVFNLGNPDEITILDLAKEIIEITGSKSEIIFEPLPVDDPRVRRPDIGRARELLNWESQTDRKKGIGKTLRYFKSCLQDEFCECN